MCANLMNEKLDAKEHDIEATSVGSDTLSGVSEDFSCSLPGNTEETNATTDQFFTAADDVFGAKQLINGTKYSNNCVQPVFTNENDKEVSDHIPGILVNKDSFGLSKNSSFEDKEDVTDVSFSSTTLPSFSWTDRDDTDIADIDIDELIRNSKQLLSNVDHTLKQSKNQSIYSIQDSDESTSGEHSELPLDSVTCGFEKNENSSIDKVSSSVQVATSDNIPPSHLNCDTSSHIENNFNTNNIENILVTDKNYLTCNSKEKGVNNSNCGSTSSTFVNNIPDSNPLTHDKSTHASDAAHNINGDDHSLVESSLAVLLEKYSNRSQNSQPHLPEPLVKVWVSQIVSAIGALHSLGIIWQDFNPNNVLLDEGGCILVTYESRWSTVDCRGKGLGTCHGNNHTMSVDDIKNSYLAPELSSPLMCPTTAADWWSVGALMYHLLTGNSLSSAHPTGITSHSEVVLPEHLSAEAASLLTQLLSVHPTERLGGGIPGVMEIKDHPFFAGIHWQ
ncbi:unnamed protein product [Meganyctiphanes norvegica]|uniref:Protein kinase domain-containing protein n=1 Tax=Meganyctiphanes norvegica TaxID=48144 RepID=A0AAV2SWN9_MEGNR